MTNKIQEKYPETVRAVRMSLQIDATKFSTAFALQNCERVPMKTDNGMQI